MSNGISHMSAYVHFRYTCVSCFYVYIYIYIYIFHISYSIDDITHYIIYRFCFHYEHVAYRIREHTQPSPIHPRATPPLGATPPARTARRPQSPAHGRGALLHNNTLRIAYVRTHVCVCECERAHTRYWFIRIAQTSSRTIMYITC